jgi:hypothetical protein
MGMKESQFGPLQYMRREPQILCAESQERTLLVGGGKAELTLPNAAHGSAKVGTEALTLDLLT